MCGTACLTYYYKLDESVENPDLETALIGRRLTEELQKCYKYEMECSKRGFQIRAVNILDPLISSNNIGRSISKSNAYRIRSAFCLGLERLDSILKQKLSCSEADIEVKKLFQHAWRFCGERLRFYDTMDRSNPYGFVNVVDVQGSSPMDSPVNSQGSSPRFGSSPTFEWSPQRNFRSHARRSESGIPLSVAMEGMTIGQELAKWAADVCKNGDIKCDSPDRSSTMKRNDSRNVCTVQSKTGLSGTSSPTRLSHSERVSPHIEMLNGIPIVNLHKLMECAKLSYANASQERAKMKGSTSDKAQASDDSTLSFRQGGRRSIRFISSDGEPKLTTNTNLQSTDLIVHLAGCVTQSEPTTPLSTEASTFSGEFLTNNSVASHKETDETYNKHARPTNWSLIAQSLRIDSVKK